MAKEVTESAQDKGKKVTKAEALAAMIWKKALGYNETEESTGKVTYHKPASWAIMLIWDRLEGKATPPDEKSGKNKLVASKVKDMSKEAKARVNKLTEEHVSK